MSNVNNTPNNYDPNRDAVPLIPEYAEMLIPVTVDVAEINDLIDGMSDDAAIDFLGWAYRQAQGFDRIVRAVDERLSCPERRKKRAALPRENFSIPCMVFDSMM